MKKLLPFIILISIISCEKPQPILPAYNAEVLSYDSRKAYCLYGWMIKIGNDTILTDNGIIGETIGYDAEFPVKANIEFSNPDEFPCKYRYYNVISLHVVQARESNNFQNY